MVKLQINFLSVVEVLLILPADYCTRNLGIGHSHRIFDDPTVSIFEFYIIYA